MQESIVYATVPKVFEVFKIIFDFIWKVISYPINFGNNFTISIFGIMAFCFIAVTLLKMFQLELPTFTSGWDSYGKFSTKRNEFKHNYNSLARNDIRFMRRDMRRWAKERRK